MISETHNGIIYLSGEVTVKTVTNAAYQQFEQQCRLNDVHTLDLAKVSLADSACVSLLLTALRLKNNQLQLSHIPESVVALSELYEIKEWVTP